MIIRTLVSRVFTPRSFRVCYSIRRDRMPDRRLLLLSSSNVHGYEYMQYATKDIANFLAKSAVSRVLFIPYAQLDHDDYYAKVGPVFRSLGLQCDSAHKTMDPRIAVNTAEAIFVGGGNTFLLLRTLYEMKLVDPIRKRVLEDGIPYIGSSAGTNVATVSIATTNDMPIVHSPSHDGLGLIPFNINPHYVTEEEREDGDGKHKGETRLERILQYLQLPGVPPVLGLREGATLHVEGDLAMLEGINSAVLFEPGMRPRPLRVGTNLSDLLTPQMRLRMTEDN